MMKSPSSSADSGGAGDAVKSEVNIDVVVIKEEPGSDPLESGSPVCGSGGEDLLKTDDVKVKEEPIDLDEPEFIPDGTIVKTEDVSLETPVTIKCDTQGLLKDETEENPFPPDFDPEDEEAYKDFLEDSGGPSDPGQISTGVGRFRCYYCGCTYHKKWLLANHVKTHLALAYCGKTGRFNWKKHLCPHCDYRSASLFQIKLHTSTHVEHPYVQCPSCPFKAKNHYRLKKHLANQKNQVSYKCEHCSFTSHHSSSLSRHLPSHQGILHRCSFCDYTASFPSTVRKHERRKHPGKLFQCGQCHQKFAGRRKLRSHLSSEHATTHLCSHCNLITPYRSELNRHIRECHGIPGQSRSRRGHTPAFFTMDQF